MTSNSLELLVRLMLAALASTVAGSVAVAQSTISGSDRYAYGGNIGWVDARSSTDFGARITENVISGYLYSANVGWIHLGDGTPFNGIAYSNASATDYGVNLDADGYLRGFAYGANIGWIQFETIGNPRVDISTGRLSGFAYGANIGWINLGDFALSITTTSIAPAIDTDTDGIADFWESLNFGNLSVAGINTDFDGDGQTDAFEAIAGTAPTSAASALRIVSFTIDRIPNPDQATVVFTSVSNRRYRIEYTSMLGSPTTWTNSGLGTFAPDSGVSSSRTFAGAESAAWYFRVTVQRPLAP